MGLAIETFAVITLYQNTRFAAWRDNLALMGGKIHKTKTAKNTQMRISEWPKQYSYGDTIEESGLSISYINNCISSFALQGRRDEIQQVML